MRPAHPAPGLIFAQCIGKRAVRRIGAPRRIGGRDQGVNLRIQPSAGDHGLKDVRRRGSQGLVRVAQPQGVTRKPGTAQKHAQPLAIPGRCAGEELMIAQRLDHPGRHDIVRLPLFLQHRAAEAVDRFRVRAPIRPPGGRSDQMAFRPPSWNTQATSPGSFDRTATTLRNPGRPSCDPSPSGPSHPPSDYRPNPSIGRVPHRPKKRKAAPLRSGLSIVDRGRQSFRSGHAPAKPP